MKRNISEELPARKFAPATDNSSPDDSKKEKSGQSDPAKKAKQDEMIKTTELRLERMRETVDEKLHKTLEERLGKSFEMVTKQLLVVQKGLGEMQTIASGVGDLKKVLMNVKTRGVLGEIQLGNILEEIMAPDQYETNVKTKKKRKISPTRRFTTITG